MIFSNKQIFRLYNVSRDIDLIFTIQYTYKKFVSGIKSFKKLRLLLIAREI